MLSTTGMTLLHLTAVAAACGVTALSQPARATDWVERYFGVGSAGEKVAACLEARGDAQGNSSRACSERRGARGDAAYTDCVCQRVTEGIHICNVNLKVSCDGTLSAASGPERHRLRGEPKGRAGGGSAAPGARRMHSLQPDLKVAATEETRPKGHYGPGWNHDAVPVR